MDYALKNPLTGSDEMNFYQEIGTVTPASLVIKLNDAFSSIAMFKTSVLIKSNEYKHKYTFEIYHK